MLKLQDRFPVELRLHRFILCTRRSGSTAHEGAGCDQSIGSTVFDAIVRSCCGQYRFSTGRLLAIEDFTCFYVAGMCMLSPGHRRLYFFNIAGMCMLSHRRHVGGMCMLSHRHHVGGMCMSSNYRHVARIVYTRQNLFELESYYFVS